MKLVAWLLVVGMAGVAAAESQAEIAAKENRAGVELMAQGKYTDAAVKFKAAFARTPDPQYAFNLCTAAFEQGRFSEALTACSAIAALHPADPLRAKTEKLITRIQDEAKAQHIEVVPAPAEDVATLKQTVARDLFELCTAEHQLGRLRDALDDCKAIARYKPAADVQSKTDKLIAKIRADAKAQKLVIE